MSAYVFIGPTIAEHAAAAELDAVYLPPVSQGDVYRVALKRPRAIGIVDGYFERVPAVWHKEILWAMAHGIHVFGAASLGALRAAELAPFGMIGIGKIFEEFRDGSLENDDAVAVVHGPAEYGFVAVSEALVDIRRTLDDATAAGVISAATREALCRTASELYYADRTYPEILTRATRQGVDVVELTAFRDWLPRGRASQKHEDAVAMLRAMKRMLASDTPQKTVRFWFEHTEWWDRAQRHAGEVHDWDEDRATIALDVLLDEVRLDPSTYEAARRGAFLRHLALLEARRSGIAPKIDAVHTALESFRRDNRLYDPDDVEHWIQDNRLANDELHRLMEEEALLKRTIDCNERHIIAKMPDHLRVTGQYPRLLARARNKQRTLQAVGLQHAGIADTGLSRDELTDWYFHERLASETPRNIAHFARTAGFADEEAFVRAIVQEFCYVRMAESPAAV